MACGSLYCGVPNYKFYLKTNTLSQENLYAVVNQLYSKNVMNSMYYKYVVMSSDIYHRIQSDLSHITFLLLRLRLTLCYYTNGLPDLG